MAPTVSSQNNHGHAKTALIVAMTRNRVIGIGGEIPWHLSEDLALFKRLTRGNTVIMGRHTYASIGAPLPDRHNIVISCSQPEQPGLTVCNSFLEGRAAAWRFGKPVFFIGGFEIYAKALQIVDDLHISWVEGDYEGDTYFPSFSLEDWTERTREQHQGFCYIHYQRSQPAPPISRQQKP